MKTSAKTIKNFPILYWIDTLTFHDSILIDCKTRRYFRATNL